MTWNQVADAAEITPEGLRAIRRGDRSPNPLTRARLEQALRWDTGSIDALMSGGAAVPIEPPAARESPAETDPRTPREIRQEKIALAQQLLAEAGRDADGEDDGERDPFDDLRAEADRVIALLEARRDARGASQLDRVLKAFDG